MNTEPTTAPAQARRRLRPIVIVAVIVLLLLIYIASPYFSFWRFSVALRNADRDAIAAHVDFAALRESMKHELHARFFPEAKTDKPKKKNRWESLLRAAAPSMIDTLVDTYITPDGLVALLARPKISATSVPSLNAELSPQTGEEAHQNLNWHNVDYAFFTSPRDFLINARGMKLRFRFSFAGWRLREIDLPPDIGA